MFTPLRTLFATLLLLTGHAFAATVHDEHGTLTLDKTPQRIVVLELSFATHWPPSISARSALPTITMPHAFFQKFVPILNPGSPSARVRSRV